MFQHNQGQGFEQIIEWANKAYCMKREAIIQKIATPWKIERRYNHKTNQKEIVNAYAEKKSTVDFGGTAKGKSIWFDAKTTKNKTSFPLTNLKGHQIDFLQRVIEQGGIGFWLIFSESEKATWILYQSKLDEFLKDYTRKSIPYQWLNDNCPKVYPSKDNPLDYLAEVLSP